MIMVIGSILVGAIFSYRSAPEDDTTQAEFQDASADAAPHGDGDDPALYAAAVAHAVANAHAAADL